MEDRRSVASLMRELYSLLVQCSENTHKRGYSLSYKVGEAR